MRASSMVFSLSLLASCATHAPVPTQLATRQVQTTLGIAQGVVGSDGVTSWRGIEYAHANRWKLPLDGPKWSGVKPFDAFGLACPQAGQARMVEDCLFLNVFVPSTHASPGKVPVVVWIHGGGFVGGKGGNDPFGFSKRGAVVMTFSYRLGEMGFHDWAGWDASMPRNFAQADMVKALQWVKANAASFGGDPENITIAGHSAGGMGVQLMMVDPRARGLFQRAIADAGYATWPLPHAANPTAEQRTRIRDAALETDVSAAQWIARRPGFHLPIVGGSDLPRSPIAMFHSGDQTEVPYMSGANSYDGYGIIDAAGWSTATFLPPYRNNPNVRAAYGSDFLVSDDQAAERMFGDMRYLFASWSTVRAMSTVKQPGYLFYFRRASNGQPGATHGDQYGHADDAASVALMAYYLAFATTGLPDVEGLPHWSPYSAADPVWMVIDTKPAATPSAMDEKMQLLRTLEFPAASRTQ